ncbi:hypothetical protein Efla_001492 [Eimeria flavescens]
MTHLRVFSRFSLAALIAALCSSGRLADPAPMDLSMRTTWRLHGEIGSSKSNFVFSPLSILSVFQSAQQGAAGDTAHQMSALLGPTESLLLPHVFEQPRGKEEAVKVKVANRVYVSNKVGSRRAFKRYKMKLEKGGHETERMDFSNAEKAAATINSFVAAATHDHIKSLISSSLLSDMTGLVLVNALYFKAPWASQFNAAATALRPFHGLSGQQTVAFMQSSIETSPLLYHLEEGLTAVGLPYADRRLRMYVFMPKDLAAFESQVASDPQRIEQIIAGMEALGVDRSFEEKLYLLMPKFKMAAEQNHVNLAEVFNKLGATDMFVQGKADFSGITGNRDLHVSAYVHQADVEVDEEGTEATAATAMTINFRSLPLPKKSVDVTIDRPFVFQIRFLSEEANLVLFSGRVTDPSNIQRSLEEERRRKKGREEGRRVDS